MLRLILPVCLAAMLANPAWAARPMITDDARITDTGACQLESWVQRFRDATDVWALPACNPGGNFEITAGGAYSHADGGSQTGAVLIQGKTLFKPLETDGWGIGIVGGYATQPGGGSSSGSPYGYIPLSFSLADDRLFLHLNLGIIRLRESGRMQQTFGLAAEFALTERIYVIGETFGQHDVGGFFQGGVRVWLIPDRVQVDATLGSSAFATHDDRWFTIGLRLLSPRLF
jgi:hypothetical protein